MRGVHPKKLRLESWWSKTTKNFKCSFFFSSRFRSKIRGLFVKNYQMYFWSLVFTPQWLKISQCSCAFCPCRHFWQNFESHFLWMRRFLCTEPMLDASLFWSSYELWMKCQLSEAFGSLRTINVEDAIEYGSSKSWKIFSNHDQYSWQWLFNYMLLINCSKWLCFSFQNKTSIFCHLKKRICFLFRLRR